jgi:hypothetical protein
MTIAVPRTITKKKFITGLLASVLAAAGVVAVPAIASGEEKCDWRRDDCNFILVSFKPARVAKVCETPLDAQGNAIGDKDCDRIGSNAVSHYWIPKDADTVAFTYDPDVTDISDKYGKKTSLPLKNDQDYCYRVTYWRRTFHQVTDDCTPD